MSQQSEKRVLEFLHVKKLLLGSTPRTEVTIKPTRSKRVTVEISGDKDQRDKMIVIDAKSTLNVFEEWWHRPGNPYVSASKKKNDDLQLLESPIVKLEITVPSDMNLILAGAWNSLRVGSFQNRVELRNYGDKPVILGAITSLNVENRSNANISVAAVRKTAFIYNVGSGHIFLNSGKVDVFTATSIGDGSIIFHGTAEKADLQVRKGGKIEVDATTERPIYLVLNGEITVKNWT